jgi:hypothetical protein
VWISGGRLGCCDTLVISGETSARRYEGEGILSVSDFGYGGEVTCFCKPWGTRELWFYASEIFPNETAVSVVQSFTHSCHHISMLEALRLLQLRYYEVLCFVFPISLCYFLSVLSYSYLPCSVISSPVLPFFTVNLFSLCLPSTPLYFCRSFLPFFDLPTYLSFVFFFF